jgi:hypothetical protein
MAVEEVDVAPPRAKIIDEAPPRAGRSLVDNCRALPVEEP